MTASAEISLQSPWLGEIEWAVESELCFPGGLPGFEQQRRIVPVEIPSQRPLIYLQSAEEPGVCFVSLPVLTVWTGFELQLSEEDRTLLDLHHTPAIGTDVLCLALLTPAGKTVQTNLDTPIVINLHNGRGVQAVSPAGTMGSFRLGEDGWEAVC